MPIMLLYGGLRQSFDTAPAAGIRNLAQFLWLEGRLPPRPLCQGIGRCGLCRVRFLSSPPPPTPTEMRTLSDMERAVGIRLACRQPVVDGMEIEVDAKIDRDAAPLPVWAFSNEPVSHANSNALRLAVDLGTTSIVWQAEDDDGHILGAGQNLNPQMSAGIDVMARLAEGTSPAGAARLRADVVNYLRGIVDDLADENLHVSEICLAANPAMTALALGLDASGLRAAPCHLPELLSNQDMGLQTSGDGLPPMWVPPHMGPFVGGDVSAGLATLLEVPRPYLLADMGTNGEFILMPPRDSRNRTELLAASVPLGPALEGVGMCCGGLAGPGGVLAFRTGPDGLEPVTFHNSAPHHICGTGYLSLLRILFSIGLIDADGHFLTAPPPAPGPLEFLRKKLVASLCPVPLLKGDMTEKELCLPLPGDLYLSAGDVESLLQVKAAFSLAVERLLTEMGMTPPDLDRIYLAGALGRHAPLDALETLGFLPAGTAHKTEARGNTSLAGAALLLRDKNIRLRLEQALSPRRVLDLASDPRFHQDFIRHMRFTSVDTPLL